MSQQSTTIHGDEPPRPIGGESSATSQTPPQPWAALTSRLLKDLHKQNRTRDLLKELAVLGTRSVADEGFRWETHFTDPAYMKRLLFGTFRLGYLGLTGNEIGVIIQQELSSPDFSTRLGAPRTTKPLTDGDIEDISDWRVMEAGLKIQIKSIAPTQVARAVLLGTSEESFI